jgi:hypothetical protein
MEMTTSAADLTDFCLVLTPTLTAAGRAADAVRKRFEFLDQGIRKDLASRVADLVGSSVERRSGGPITVIIALERSAIHGEVSDRTELVPFQIPLAPAAST